LVATRSPEVWADTVSNVLAANATNELSESAALVARSYTWTAAAHALVDLVAALHAEQLLHC